MTSPPAVPRPAEPGPRITAIANVRNTYVNIRTGPGTQYTDIGDIRDNALVYYYPQTLTGNNWYWVEHQRLAGWVSGDVTEFEQAVGMPPGRTPTPYDGAVAVWHWKGQGLAVQTIQQLVDDIRQKAPNVKQVWVKTSDGTDWMGRFDNSAMAINGTADVAQWVDVLNRNGLEFHAWCVPQGLDIEREVALIAAVCNVPGVKSMVLDVEPYAGFWQGGRDAVRPFGIQLRQSIPSGFHVGMSMDPRPWHYASIFPEEWRPFINSLHPQVYWFTFQNTPEAALLQAYDTWGSYGLPIVPALQGDAPVNDQQVAHTLATQRHAAPGLSWWRYGVFTSYVIVNQPVELPEEPDEEPPPGDFDEETLVIPGGTGFRNGTYTGQPEFEETTTDPDNWTILYKETEARISTVWAEWRTALTRSGRYEISTFVPAEHATTQRARFKVHGIKGTTTETILLIDQSRYMGEWVSLGVFELVQGAPNAGRVFLNDVTGETDREIAFAPVRFRRLIDITVPDPDDPGNGEGEIPPATDDGSPIIIDGVPYADGYDSPIGTIDDRVGFAVWPSGWRDATGFGANTVPIYIQNYRSYHTGVDLNFGSTGNADIGLPVYATASGVVMHQADVFPWGNLTIIRHDPLVYSRELFTYSRYGHMQNVRVQVGQRVRRGEQIGEIGTGGGRYVAHLHFDISPTTVLETRPGDWPGLDLDRLLRTYADPLAFVNDHRPARG